MTKTIGTIVVGILVIGMVTNGSINPVPALQTVLRFFAGGLNAVVNDGKTQINITVPPSEQRPPEEQGYQP